ncbi:T-complex protein 1 subunit delta [Aduncisulcus paluster]|uniref:T-complex protein 1 subunit delta n=1 Tax=Aduncisulcus paluster TaxID=2918883 RepID=A0ABQ5JYV3_9EUKA|nr:T-complex protein 1 subunit delta [Aduncisulcus paluster]|eukprot:gnl/Carplike_NY0171/636_a873_2125.p1 GENE.gnl/Carplike_NY0171/636_a873_2125~~gnl/Carplike_NY0171/636_a873_2125.p1  ORF type:complete len:541 (+),score=150.46 gnl/Carplike_NY0171/636_a873_2125:29-1651(+)
MSQQKEVRKSNIAAATAIQDIVRTSLGPRGMDKMVTSHDGRTTITNDGATIMKELQVAHPAARMLVELSQAQDIEAGDGTTSVVVMAGSLLKQSEKLIDLGIHPSKVSDAFQHAEAEAQKVLLGMSKPIPVFSGESIHTPVDFSGEIVDTAPHFELIRAAATSLSSKVVHPYSDLLSRISVETVRRCVDPAKRDFVDLNFIKMVKRKGDSVDKTEIVDGLVLSGKPGDECRISNAKIGLIRFCISPPKTDMDSSVVVSTAADIDRMVREEYAYIRKICTAIIKAKCNVLLIQKSITRTAIDNQALGFFKKYNSKRVKAGKPGILVVSDIERNEIEFISRTCGCTPVATIEEFTSEKLGSADLAVRAKSGTVRITGCRPTTPAFTTSVLIRGPHADLLDEIERSLHDAMCVIRCFVKMPFMLPGGGAAEVELTRQLQKKSLDMTGIERYAMRAYADAFEVIPLTLAENAGLNAMATLAKIRSVHKEGGNSAGIEAKTGEIRDMFDEDLRVFQPLLVTSSAVKLATETVRTILKISDIVLAK